MIKNLSSIPQKYQEFPLSFVEEESKEEKRSDWLFRTRISEKHVDFSRKPACCFCGL